MFGVKEIRGESGQSIMEELCSKTDILIDMKTDIDTIHRIKSNLSPRPIIIGFSTHDKKMEFMKKRKTLKGTKIVLADDLCVDLFKTLNRLRNHKDVKDAWSWDSQLFAKRHDGKIATVTWGQPFDTLLFK